MKQFMLSLLSLSLLGCFSLDEPDFQSVVPKSEEQRKGHLLNELREIAQVSSNLGKENFEFISKKLKVAITHYKILKKKVMKLEVQVSQLTDQLQQQEQMNQRIKLEPVTIEMDDTLIDDVEKELQTEVVTPKKPLQPKSLISKTKEDVVSQPVSANKEHQKIFKDAKILFTEKNWESAIAKFEEYRRVVSKSGVGYRKATLYIGQSFQNLKLKPEAKIFFNELTQSYPQSQEAAEAKKLLK